MVGTEPRATRSPSCATARWRGRRRHRREPHPRRERSAPDEFGPPEPVVIPVIERICKAAPCSGKLARLWVLRKDNRIQRYLHHGDPTACSDPPSVYFDRHGREVGGIGMRPVQKGSEDERRLNKNGSARGRRDPCGGGRLHRAGRWASRSGSPWAGSMPDGACADRVYHPPRGRLRRGDRPGLVRAPRA